MAWTPAQVKAAKALYNRKGNRLSWPECIAKATKGGPLKRKKAAVSGIKKKAPKKAAKKVTVIKARARQVNVKVGSLGSISLSKVRECQADIERLEKRKAAAQTGAERKQISGMISLVKKTKNSFKKYL